MVLVPNAVRRVPVPGRSLCAGTGSLGAVTGARSGSGCGAGIEGVEWVKNGSLPAWRRC